MGSTSGRIVNSWAACSVSGSDWAGGLAGWNVNNHVVASYATGDVRGDAAGGLVGNNGATITASYATGSVRGSLTAGGLAARNGAGAGIVASYAAARVSGNAAFPGGLVGRDGPSGRVESSYWDVDVSGQANSGGGEGRTTADMQAPTGYDGIYRNWNRDLDGDGAADDPWDFGTTAEYPALKADVDGDGRSTWPEFGDQRGRGGNPDPPPGQPPGEPPGEPPAGDCVADAETFCFQNSRFAVEMDWWTSDGRSGPGKAAADGANDSGMFWFFNPDNWEVLIKVLDGCALNDHVWVFAASATDLGYSIRVTDTMTRVFREYRKEDGLPADAITDSRAFPGVCAAPSPAAPRSRP